MMSLAGTGPMLPQYNAPRSSERFAAPYGVLAVVHLLLGIAFIAIPLKAGRVLFGPTAVEHEHLTALLRLTSTLFFTGATISWALLNAAIVGSIFNSEGQRLKASLVLLSLGSIALHVIYIKTITWWGLAIGALAMGATLLVPIITLGIGNAHLFSPGNVIGGVATGIRTLLDRTTFTSLASLLFATATLVFSVAGLAYLALPRATLHAVLSITNTPPAVFLWQHLGWGLLVACSTLTFVLTDAANNAWLEDVVARTLSVGLLLVGVVHLAVLVPVMTKIGVHWLTVVLTGAWGGGVLAAVVGLAVALQPVQQRNGYGTL